MSISAAAFLGVELVRRNRVWWEAEELVQRIEAARAIDTATFACILWIFIAGFQVGLWRMFHGHPDKRKEVIALGVFANGFGIGAYILYGNILYGRVFG